MAASLSFAIEAVNKAKETLAEVEGELGGVEGKANSSGSALEGMGGKMAAAGVLAAGAGIAIGGMIAKESISAASELGDAVNSLSIATGMSDTKASEWIGVGEHFGLTAEYMQKSMDKASKAIFGGIDPTTGLMVAGGVLDTTLEHYGITTKDVSGKALDMNTIMLSTSDVFQKMPDGPEKTALALKLFGKAGVDMIPMLDQGSAGVQKLMGTVDDMGLTLDASGVQKTKDFAFAQRDMSEALKGVEVQIGMALMPILTTMFTFMSTTAIPAIHDLAVTWLPKIKQGFNDFLTAVQPVAAAIMPIIGALAGNKEALEAVAITIGVGLVIAFGALAVSAGAAAVGVIAATWPLLAIAAAVAGVTFVILELINHWDDLTAAVPGLQTAISAVTDFFTQHVVPIIGTVKAALQSVISFATDIWPAIKEKLSGPFQAAFDNLKLIATTEFGYLKGIFQTQIDLVKGIIKLVLDLIHGDFGKFWADLKTLVGSMFEDIKGLFSTQLGLVEGLVSTALTAWIGVITGAVPLFLDAGTAILTGLYQGAMNVAVTILTWIASLPGQFVSMLGDLGGLLVQKGDDLIHGLLRGAIGAALYFATWVISLPGQIIGWLGDLGTQLYNYAYDAIGRMAQGVIDGASKVIDAVSGVIGDLNPFHSPPGAHELPGKYYDYGVSVAGKFASGLASGAGKVTVAASALVTAAAPVAATTGTPAPTPTGTITTGVTASPTWFQTMGNNSSWAYYTAKALSESTNALNFSPIIDVIAALNKFGSLQAFQTAGGVSYPDMMTLLRAKGLSFDQGGWLPPGLTMAYNGTGSPERVSPGHGGDITINFYGLDVINDPIARRKVATVLRDEMLAVA